jgi:hypothetical protein
MGPLAAVYHPGGTDPEGYPVALVDLITTWSEEIGTVIEAVCVTTDGALRLFEADRVQVVDRAVAEAIVAASAAADRQRGQQGRVPPPR